MQQRNNKNMGESAGNSSRHKHAQHVLWKRFCRIRKGLRTGLPQPGLGVAATW